MLPLIRSCAPEGKQKPYVVTLFLDGMGAQLQPCMILGTTGTLAMAKTIRLKFAPDVATIMEETKYHPSQEVKRQADGSVIMTIKVAISMEFCSWILRWGEKVEVLEPEELRQEITRTVREMTKIYG